VSFVVVFIQIDVLRIKLYLKYAKGKKRNTSSKLLLLYCVSSLWFRDLLRYYIWSRIKYTTGSSYKGGGSRC